MTFALGFGVGLIVAWLVIVAGVIAILTLCLIPPKR